MKTSRRNLLALVILSAVLALSPPLVLADAIVSVLPSDPAPGVGSFFDISVNIDSVTDLYAYQFDISFDPAILSAISVTEGSFLPGEGTTFFIPGAINNIAGSITFTADTLSNVGPGVDGSGSLAHIHLQALAVGTSPIGLSNVILLDSALSEISFSTNGVTVSPVGTVTPIPEPSTMVLFGSGLIGLWRLKRKFRK